MRKLTGLLAGTALLALSAAPGHAATFFGVTYNLTGAYTNVEQSAAHFILNITGINAAADTEGGRFGVNAYAFNLPANFLSASSPGFTFVLGGLNSTGCNGSGAFFCFDANAPKPSTVLAANSSLQFTFDLAVTAGHTLAAYGPDFKIDWLGTKNNYDLISQPLGISGGITPFVSEVPIPGAVWLFGSGIVGLAALARRRKRQAELVA